jgi:hypothetical protein
MPNPRHPVKASGLGCNITDEVATAAVRLGGQMIALADRAVVVAGLDEQRRYPLRYSFGYQVHDG